MKIQKLDIYTFRAEVSQTVVTSFSTIPSRAACFIRIEDSEGNAGLGEVWGNFPVVTTEYRARLSGWALPPHLIDAEIDDGNPGAFCRSLRDKLHVLAVQADEPGPVDSMVAATSQALWDLAARRAGKSLRTFLNPAAAETVPAYASGLNPGDCVEIVARCRDQGYRAFKLKIGFGADIDERNIEALYRDMSDSEVLMTDANQRWNLSDAIDNANRLARYPLKWFEEPMLADRPPTEWQTLRQECPLPLAGGENLRGRQALAESAQWFEFIQPDVGKWGGVEGCLEAGNDAVQAGRVYCPHWLSGGIGLLHSAHLLAAVGGDGLLEVDSNENPLRTIIEKQVPGLIDGSFDPGLGVGLGIELPLEALERWQTSHQSF